MPALTASRHVRQTDNARNDQGFTLIELMVVVLIIAILLAIAIPTFLGSQNRARDRAAQSALRNTVTAARSIYTDSGDYSTAINTAIKAIEPSLTYNVTGTASTGPNIVSVNPGTSVSTVFYAAAKSGSGTCFYLRDDLTSTTATGTTFAKGNGTCNGTTAATQTYSSTGW